MKEIGKNIPKTYLFFVAALVSAFLYQFYPILSFIISLGLLFFFINRPFNFAAIFLFILSALIAPKFFIVTDVTEYKNYNLIKTPTAWIIADKLIQVSEGEVLRGKFVPQDNSTSKFAKPKYIADNSTTSFSLPIITKIMEYRLRASDKMFYASGGKVRTAQALIFADKRFIPEDLRDQYTITGLAHLLAMSGTHTGIIIALFLSALFFIPIKFRMVFALVGIGIICVFGAFTVTVVRASIFAAVFMVCYIADIKVESKKFLLFVMGMFMIYSPLSLTDISFLLSFGAVFGIIYLLSSGIGFLKAALLTGVAATLITAPLSMYAFGMTNHLSVFSTMMLAPVMYLHILFALMFLAFPNIAVEPLILVESFSNYLVGFFTYTTYFGFFLKTIPLWALILCILFTVATLASKYKWLSLLVLLIIFYPAPKPPEFIFPSLTGSNKGFISFSSGRSQIFYQGNPGAFKRSFLAVAAKYGINEFDYGDIRIFGGKNNYLKIKEKGKNFTNICLNIKDNDCKIIYHTRSNTITYKDLDNETLHIIYKNKLEHTSIYEFSKVGDIIINNGEIIINDYNNHE